MNITRVINEILKVFFFPAELGNLTLYIFGISVIWIVFLLNILLAIFKKINRCRSVLIMCGRSKICYTITTHGNFLTLERFPDLSRDHGFLYLWVRLSRLYHPHRLFSFNFRVSLFMIKMTLVNDTKKIEKIKMATTKIRFNDVINYA